MRSAMNLIRKLEGDCTEEFEVWHNGESSQIARQHEG